MTTSSRDSHSPLLCLVVAPTASQLEEYAARELQAMLQRLFHVEAVISCSLEESAAAHIVIGRPETHPLVAKLSMQRWPELSSQGVLLRSVEQNTPTLVAGGGSDVATLWAVYELAERLGVRYLHHRDVYPTRRPFTGLPTFDVVMEPNLPIRCWRLLNEAPHGPISWSLEENIRFIRQMAKMKFNRMRFEIWPAQPFVHYSIRGMAKPKGTIYFGEHYAIDEDTIGREKLGDRDEFTNPQLAECETAEELHRRAVHLLKSMLAESRRLGMETALAFNAAEWPKEFHKVLPGTEPVTQVGSLTIGPGSNQPIDDPLLREASATVIRTCIETYPEVDYLILSMPEHGHWTGHADEAFQNLVTTYNVKEIGSFDWLCSQARHRTNFPGGGQRVERQLKNDLSALWFLDSVVREYRLLKRPGGGPDFKLVYDSITEELFPLVAHVAPQGGEVVSFLDYTASRQLSRRDLLEHVPPRHVPATLIFTLADDNVGVLPQLANASLHTLMGLLRDHEWSGFNTRFWTIGDLDPTIHLLARGSWNASLTPRDAYIDQVLHVCGNDSVAPALAAFEIIENITLGLDQHGLGFGFIVPAMMTQHFDAGGLSPEIREDRVAFVEALKLMEQAHAASRAEGREYTGYFVNRLTFAVRYLDACESFGAVATALQQNRSAEALKQAERAIKAIRESLQAYANVARDHGDLGAIAAMNEYCYRPMVARLNQIKLLHGQPSFIASPY